MKANRFEAALLAALFLALVCVGILAVAGIAAALAIGGPYGTR